MYLDRMKNMRIWSGCSIYIVGRIRGFFLIFRILHPIEIFQNIRLGTYNLYIIYT